MPFSSFEHKIKDKLQDATVQPTAEVWDKISDQLQIADSDDVKPAMILPFFIRRENLGYTASAAAAVALLAVTLNVGTPGVDNTVQDLYTDAKVVEENPADCQETIATEIRKENNTLIYNKENTKPTIRFTSLKEEPTPGFQLLVNHEVTPLSIPANGLVFGKKEKLEELSPLTPLKTSISYRNAKPDIQLAVAEVEPVQVIPVIHKKKKTFKPQVRWGLTAMSALQLNSLSGAIQSQEFEDNLNLAGISSLSAQFEYPNALTSGRAEVEVQLSEKFGISSGLGLSGSYQNSTYARRDGSVREVNNDFTNLNSNPGQQGSGVSALASSLSPINELSYQSLDIPLFVNYYLKKGRSKFILSTGLLYRHILNKDPEWLVETVSYTNNAQSSLRFVDAMAGDLSIRDLVFLVGRAHYQLNLGSSMALHAGPTINYGMGSAFSYQDANSRQPLSLGFEVGLKFFPGG